MFVRIRGLHRGENNALICYFQPASWAFWRCLIVAFCLCSWLGHFLEIPYCFTLESITGIIEDDYAVRADPLFVPYHVYGIGAVAMTLLLEPLKERILTNRKTVWGAVLEMFAFAIAISAFLETVIGLIINQPDANGLYPYWDNSQLPLNILGQGWLINDLVIGLIAMVYIWVLFPCICNWLEKKGQSRANTIFCLVVITYLVCSAFGLLRELGIVSQELMSHVLF